MLNTLHWLLLPVILGYKSYLLYPFLLIQFLHWLWF
jgi:hypothetical protein